MQVDEPFGLHLLDQAPDAEPKRLESTMVENLDTRKFACDLDRIVDATAVPKQQPTDRNFPVDRKQVGLPQLIRMQHRNDDIYCQSRIGIQPVHERRIVKILAETGSRVCHFMTRPNECSKSSQFRSLQQLAGAAASAARA